MRRGYLSPLSLSLGALLSGFDLPFIITPPAHTGSRTAKRHRIGGARYASNGKRECARRVRQIEAGQLTSANGLLA